MKLENYGVSQKSYVRGQILFWEKEIIENIMDIETSERYIRTAKNQIAKLKETYRQLK